MDLNSAQTEEEVIEEDQPEAETSTDAIKKAYFSSDKVGEAQEYINKVMAVAEEHNLTTVFNFDTDKEFPAGYGIAIIPIAKRHAGETVVLGVAIGAIPDMETVAAHENGKQFILDAVVGSMIAKLANAVRPRGDNDETASSIPFSVEDFITSNRPEGVLLAYRTYANAYVKLLKKKGLKFITESILRQTLQSRAFAEQQFPSVDQAKWVQIIDSMIARATSEGMAPGMLSEWKESRDSAALPTKDVDLSDLDFSEAI